MDGDERPQETDSVYISYPQEKHDSVRSPSPQPAPRTLLKDRLYVGNLHPSIDEYTLLQIFSKFGKVTKLDFLFHKTGPAKGRPRGYAFVEYGSSKDASKALTHAHDKPLRGRTLVVTFAHQAPVKAGGSGFLPFNTTGKHSRKTINESGRPTTLSMLKCGGRRERGGTKTKIAQLEAKLRQMDYSAAQEAASSALESEEFWQTNELPDWVKEIDDMASDTPNLAPPPKSSRSTGTAFPQGKPTIISPQTETPGAGPSSLRLVHELPKKPPPSTASPRSVPQGKERAQAAPAVTDLRTTVNSLKRPASAPISLPQAKRQSSLFSQAQAPTPPKKGLAGVKIVKRKKKEVP